MNKEEIKLELQFNDLLRTDAFVRNMVFGCEQAGYSKNQKYLTIILALQSSKNAMMKKLEDVLMTRTNVIEVNNIPIGFKLVPEETTNE